MTERDRPQGNFEAVSDGYFTALGLKVLEGRDFTIEDNDEKQPVAIVNASFAHKYFGRESAIGRRVRIFDPAQPRPWRTIVGVVPDMLMQGPFNTQSDNSGFYIPLLGRRLHRNLSPSLFVHIPASVPRLWQHRLVKQ